MEFLDVHSNFSMLTETEEVEEDVYSDITKEVQKTYFTVEKKRLKFFRDQGETTAIGGILNSPTQISLR